MEYVPAWLIVIVVEPVKVPDSTIVPFDEIIENEIVFSLLELAMTNSCFTNAGTGDTTILSSLILEMALGVGGTYV